MNTRFKALELLSNRKRIDTPPLSGKVSERFGCNVFTDEVMKQYLVPKAYKRFKKLMTAGEGLDRDLADHIAESMKKWALNNGVTHYAHWFQPLTGRTAEKHDSFFTLDHEGNAIEEFTGDELVQQEPDGSSFPGGGLRTTFEARGYTAWDPSSPAFIFDIYQQKTLYIPTIFVTYGGQSLDYKLPLLKSQAYLEEAALKVCRYFDSKATRINVTLGWEQEYFVVDEALFNARPDLLLTGRTLLGRLSPKGQQLDDHYFGRIPENVYAFMTDLEQECYQLGIPLRTRHNEVAPGQYEFAPIYEDVNIAVDHNQLLMDVMERVAIRHKLRVLFHEKPFAGVNGSGKHNNWSMATNRGKNLLSPGKEPGNNLQFLTFFMATIQAVNKHADILRASIASASNDHRLGANEAPPAIVSVFIGEALTKVLHQIENGNDTQNSVKEVLNLLSQIPDLELDNTDRNRTSPFAFTGNKFEIRMAGSTVNCAAPMTVMNMIVGKQLREFDYDVQILQKEKKLPQDRAILMVIKNYIQETKKIRFEGDGYSDEWRDEALRRGLSNHPNTPEALEVYENPVAQRLFEEAGILSRTELHAHYEVQLEAYILKMQIESLTLGEICMNQILPAAIGYQNELIQNIKGLKELELGEDAYEGQLELVKEMSTLINEIKRCIRRMLEERKKAKNLSPKQKARAYCDEVKPIMEQLRNFADELEPLVDDARWPLVKYRELLFLG